MRDWRCRGVCEDGTRCVRSLWAWHMECQRGHVNARKGGKWSNERARIQGEIGYRLQPQTWQSYR